MPLPEPKTQRGTKTAHRGVLPTAPHGSPNEVLASVPAGFVQAVLIKHCSVLGPSPSELFPSIPSPFAWKSLLRKPARRSFTVEIKHSATSGRTFIPARPRQALDRAKPLPGPASAALSVFEPKLSSTSGTPKATQPRRILPSLIAWEPSQPEPEPQAQPEGPLPRVRRALPAQTDDEAPRRRSRLPKLRREPKAAVEAAIPVLSPPRVESPVRSQAVPRTLAHSPRNARPDGAELPRAERWKRRLPRACW